MGMKPVTRTIETGHILYEGTLLDHVDEALFAPVRTSNADAGRGTTLFFAHAGLQLVLRHFRRGGLPARILADRYFWTGLTGSRPWREWHLLATLHALGLPVPQPVAARVVRRGIFYRGDLVTERLPARPLSTHLARRSLPAATWRAIGACIRRFHDVGAFHADLNAHNILLADDGRVFVIDFDRGELRAPGPWHEANLRRLRRSFEKLRSHNADFAFDDAAWQELLAGYTADRSPDGAQRNPGNGFRPSPE
ncbi:MAG: 3-deoxy-D-manno-octulosonic acid kinase [Hydrogenophaga sp.]